MSSYEGLRVGLEIHFQLNTPRKLFCHCPVGLTEPEGPRIIRRLRPTQSELGQIDPAAYFEFQKGTVIEYIAPPDYCCLVELDEEPPHEICPEALYTAISVARFLNCRVVDELEVMRKVVIDGSNTTGFQRTLLVAVDGHIEVGGKRIGIQSVCLEEEAARLIKREGNKVVYCLDRMGIPLIEIATAPDISTPEEAVRVAEYIGRVVSSTGMRRRGIGTIRQDINISVMGGTVVEIKGVQRLPQLRKVVEFEYKRHLGLMRIRDILRERGVRKEDIREEFVDVTDVFRSTGSRVVRGQIKQGNRILAVALKGFSGLLKMETAPGYRLGREMAERVRFWAGLGGILHSDELPGYGISQAEVDAVRAALGCGEGDAFVLIAADEDRGRIAAEKVVERAREAIDGVPAETRGAKEDGTTFYMRPRPGMARMYPETDIPPIRVTPELLERASEIRVVRPEAVVAELVAEYGINETVAWNLFDSDMVGLFRGIMSSVRRLKATYVASLLTEIIKSLESEGIDTSRITDELIKKTVIYVDQGLVEKEAIPELWAKVVKEGVSLEEAVKEFAAGKPTEEQIVEYARQLLSEEGIARLPPELRRKRVIGLVMSRYRGKVDPKLVVSVVDKLMGEGG
ncbi:Glu-tRNA(Gln) amidotransferase GatDE subunit E [Candidatus Geothermarchaeota archaeon ex4572_27]|nr:MAG: Glu-tRNA(Gln) amidotransferase GatDE subunit E [Candidatus Geothermarchaeota archaeon ex4572_27]